MAESKKVTTTRARAKQSKPTISPTESYTGKVMEVVNKLPRLTVSIDGREALPVRAIPYVTGWQRFSPDTVAASCLAGEADFFMRVHLTAYRISGDELIQVTPRQWDAVVVKLKGLAAKLRRQHGDDDMGDDIGYDAWRSGAVEILPADAFVWLDELEKEYKGDQKSQFYYETRPSDDELILEPMLDADTIAMVMKGFEKYLMLPIQQVIPELEREVKRIAELESDPILRAILTGRIILTADEIADSIKDGFLEGKVIYDSNGAPDPKRSTITANELPRFLDFIHRSLEKTKMSYLAQQNIEGDPASINLGYYAAVACDVGSVGDWDYWASLPRLEPREVACLMFELEPKHFDEIHSARNTHLQPGALADEIDKVERSATRDHEGEKLSPEQWIEWAQGKGYAVPEKFVEAVAEVERKAHEESERTAQEEAQKNDYFIKYGANPSDRIYPVWQNRMNEIVEDFKSKSRLNRYPTKGVAAKLLAIELVAKDLVAPNIISSNESQKKIEKMRVNIERHTQKEWGKKRLA